MYHGNAIVVYVNFDSPTGHIVKLYVDVVPSKGGHSQLSVVILHAACQVAVSSTDRPVLYHLKEIKKNALFKKKYVRSLFILQLNY